MEPKIQIIVAIDGFSSSGKSTLAKDVAKKLSYIYIDSGSMYRAVTLYSLENNCWTDGVLNENLLNNSLGDINIEFRFVDGRQSIFLNDENVEEKIRSMDVSAKVSEVSRLAPVRLKLVVQQRQMGKDKGIVMDGRDIGSAVFPEAEIKIFVTADPKVRAKRRFDELKASNNPTEFEEVLENLQHRDYMDTHRAINPLLKASDAYLLDTTFMDRKAQLNTVLAIIRDNYPVAWIE